MEIQSRLSSKKRIGNQSAENISNRMQRLKMIPIMPRIKPAVDMPVGRVPSFFALEIAPKMTARKEGRTVQQEHKPARAQISDATAKPSEVFCRETSAGFTGVY